MTYPDSTLAGRAARHRVPIEDPKWWVVSLDSESVDVTDDELVLIRAYTEMIVTAFYREPFASKAIADKKGCWVNGHNTVTLLKRADGGWGYRRHTWTMGPRYVPPPTDEPTPLSGLLERIETMCWGSDDPGISSRWTRWIETPDGARLLEAVT